MRWHGMFSLPLIVLAVSIAAPAAPDGTSPDTDAPKSNVGGVDAKGGGVISGVVLFKGAKPKPKELTSVAGNAFCKQCYKDALPVQDTFVFGRNGDNDTLQYVLVYVSKGLEGKTFEAPKRPVVLDQVACVYAPHVVAVMAGQPLEIRNSDATLHNVMTAPNNNPSFNFGMPVKDQKVTKVFRAAEFKVNLRCFMHPWMSAYVHVLGHPFFAVTGADGTFTLHGLPPGEYEVTVLHESSLFEATPSTATLMLTEGGRKRVEFTYAPRSEKK
jgi:plastocyanin